MDYKNELNSDDDFDCSNSYGDSYNNNNSNSGYNGSGQTNANGGLSKAELRKTNKPIMEKRRRARINHCLNELKSLILEAMKKDPARHTKLEKADILEMTVKHLQSVQRQQLNMAIQTDPSVIHKFKTGFVECADEVNRYINQLDGVEATVRQRLTNHLNSCATGLEQIGSMTNFNNGYRGQLGANTVSGLFTNALGNPLTAAAAAAASATTAPIFPPLPQDLNNNSNPAAASAPILIPSRLPSGEFALIIPNGNHATSLLNNNNNSPFATWPHNNSTNVATKSTTITHQSVNQPQINDFATNFQRMSAFSKPQILQNQKLNTINITPNHKSHTLNNNQHQFTTTPAATFHQPQNNLHQNSTTTTVSPPLSPISTVSSHGDDSSIMHTSSDFITSRPSTPPQDVAISQHNFSGVFSTPSTPSSAESSLSLSTHLQQQQVSSTSGGDLNASLKRPRSSDAADSSDSSDELSAKKFHTAMQKSAEQEEEKVSTWRPW